MTLTTPTELSVVAENAKHFPDDQVWQRHCAKLAARLNAMKILGKAS